MGLARVSGECVWWTRRQFNVSRCRHVRAGDFTTARWQVLVCGASAKQPTSLWRETDSRRPQRSGITLGAAFSGTHAGNEFKLQGLLGYFSGFSLSPVLQSVNTAIVGFAVGDNGRAGGIVQMEEETQHVSGSGYGFSVIDSYKPFKSNFSVTHRAMAGLQPQFPRAEGRIRVSAQFRESSFPPASGRAGI